MTDFFACSRCGAQNIPFGLTPCPHCAAPLAYAPPAAVPMSATTPMAPYVVPAGSMSAAAPLPIAGGQLATIGPRFVAGLLDVLIIGVPTSLIFGTTDWSSGWSWSIDFPSAVVYWLYAALLMSSSWQATLGMRVMSLRVVREGDGGPLSFVHATGRHFAELISVLTLGIGYLMIAFTEQHQALHDKLASTLVVRD